VKALILFLNCYILFLSLLSCKDKEELGSLQEVPGITVQHSPGTVHPEDVCPPFCTCTCCSVYKTVPEYVQLDTQINTIIPKRFSAFKISSPKEVSLSFWQPPRLA